MPDFLVWPGLVLLGAAVGSYGVLVGAGGGFILGPILLIIYPDMQPEVVTALSLAVVSAAGASGTVAYSRQQRIDYVAGGMFVLTTVPGAILGASLTGLVPRDSFQTAFGVLLCLMAASLMVPRPNIVVTTPPPARFVRRLVTDANGLSFRYSFDPVLSMTLGLAIGTFSTMFGIGGGVMLVPLMVLVLRFPSYIATATSTFVLLFSALTGLLVHLISGHYAGVEAEGVSLAAGVLVGAQVGAFISMKLANKQVVVARLLSLALVVVGLRLLTSVLL